MRISTRIGDNGESLIKGKKIAKDSLLFEVIGTLDELMSFLGLVKAEIKKKKEKELLLAIQRDLSQINGVLVGCLNDFKKEKVLRLEKEITKLEKKLPPIKKFVYPGESKIASLFHISRTVCRRAERRVVALNRKKKIQPAILSYLNRLSDLLFLLAF